MRTAGHGRRRGLGPCPAGRRPAGAADRGSRTRRRPPRARRARHPVRGRTPGGRGGGCRGPAPWRSRTRLPAPSHGRRTGRRASWPPSRGSALGRPRRPCRTVVGRLPGRTWFGPRARASAANRTLGPFVGSLARGDDACGSRDGRVRRVLPTRLLADSREPSKQPIGLATLHVRDRAAVRPGRWPSFRASSSTWPMLTWPCAASASWPSTRCAGWPSSAQTPWSTPLRCACSPWSRHRSVLSTSQLLHGAVGFCDEHDLGVITASVQSSLAAPDRPFPHARGADRGDRRTRIRGTLRSGASCGGEEGGVSARVAVVTGGSGGIGTACAAVLVERGYDVVLTARDAGRLAEAAEQLGRVRGSRLHAHRRGRASDGRGR